MKPILFFLLLLFAALSSAKADARPNIVIILVDDMGFSDIGCYGGEIPTPHIDALAENGVRFSQFYNTGRCCPTRVSLHTGLYSHQAGVGHMTKAGKAQGYIGHLNERCVTIGNIASGAGTSLLFRENGMLDMIRKNGGRLPGDLTDSMASLKAAVFIIVRRQGVRSFSMKT